MLISFILYVFHKLFKNTFKCNYVLKNKQPFSLNNKYKQSLNSKA